MDKTRGTGERGRVNRRVHGVFFLSVACGLCLGLAGAPAHAEAEASEGTETPPAPAEAPCYEDVVLEAAAAEAAASFPAGGACGGGLAWELGEDGLLTIRGTGAMDDYGDIYDADGGYVDYLEPPWYGVREEITGLEIESGAETIGNWAFYGCVNLTCADIPESVAAIGEYAFDGCSSLTDIALPSGLTAISAYMFSDCAALESISLPGGAAVIGGYAFSGCKSLAGISLPEGITAIGERAFCGCTSLTAAVLPESTASVGNAAFLGCTGLTRVCIPNGAAVIGESVFSGCTGLKTAGPVGGGYDYEFGWTEALPPSAFFGCGGLTGAALPEGMTAIGPRAFGKCAALRRIDIPESVSGIGTSAFFECASLTSVSLPAGVTVISDGAFEACAGLESVSLGVGVSGIGEYAFYGCASLRSVTIPEGVEYIGYGAFEECASLRTVCFEGGPPEMDEAFSGVTASVHYYEDIDAWAGYISQSAFPFTWVGTDRRVLSDGRGAVTVRQTDRWPEGAELTAEVLALAEEPAWPEGVSVYRYTVYDISLTGAEPEGELTVSVALPLGYGENCRVYCMDEAAGVLTDMNAVFADDAMTFVTSHFSVYIIAQETAEEPLRPGDVNRDGRVSISDAMTIVRAAVGLVALDETEQAAADVSENGYVTCLDALIVASWVLDIVDGGG